MLLYIDPQTHRNHQAKGDEAPQHDQQRQGQELRRLIQASHDNVQD